MHYGYRLFDHMGGGYFMILLWVLIIVGIIYFISRSNIDLGSRNNKRYRDDYRDEYNSYSRTDKKRPEEIARERYAKGEIDKEELNDILKELNR